MKLVDLFGGLFFRSFDEAVSFFCSQIPYLIIFVFGVNVVFSILYDVMHLGGKK